MSVPSAAARTTTTMTGRTPYLPYLEGLRGLVALYVVLYHIRASIDPGFTVAGAAATLLPGNGFYLLYGHSAVSCFIVISGYVLTLPLACRSTFDLDYGTFLRRRARRLLPGYYAALFLSIPFFLLTVHQLHTTTSLGHFAVQLGAHVLLLHNLFTRTVFGIDAPLWSVATEVQIYFVFVFFIIPLQKRIGLLLSTVLAFALGLIPTALGEIEHVYSYHLIYASFWLIGLFAAGSVAAWIGYGPQKYARWRSIVPWKWLSIAGFLAFAASIIPDYGLLTETLDPLPDILFGFGIASGFVAIAKDAHAGRTSTIARFFALPAFIRLGSFSYSLYLIHDPILSVVSRWALAFPPALRLKIDFGMLPAIVLLAYGFARVFEFPFVSAFRKKNDELAIHHVSVDSSAIAAT